MKKRKSFFIKGNFQLKFILLFVALLAVEIAFGIFWVYRVLEKIIEKAAFSSHLSLQSSMELFWGTVIRVNMIMAAVSILVGILVIVLGHMYLQKFLDAVSQVLREWAKGDFSTHLKTKRWWGGTLARDMNKVSSDIRRQSGDISKTIDFLEKLLEKAPQKDFVPQAKNLHHKLYF